MPESTSAWTTASVLDWATRDFRARGLDSARLDAELLLARALGCDRIRLILDPERVLLAEELSGYRELIRRRRRQEPVAYILGEREFFGLPLRVDGRVLIPRPDTETLVEVALRRTAAQCLYGTALDVCTGSGCVAIALARERPTWHVGALDISEAALAVARENALRSGVAHIHFEAGDLFSGLSQPGRYSVITANPPYIPSAQLADLPEDVRGFEPRLALDGGADGFLVIERLVAGAPDHLDSGGLLAIEIGVGQAERAVALFQRAEFVDIEPSVDYGGRLRVISGRLPLGS